MTARRLPFVVVAVTGVTFIAMAAFVSSRRLTFPYDVEWMEGGVLMQAERFMRGEPLFPKPSATFVPFFYPPLYPALLGLLGRLFGGVSYALGRSVSLGASIGSAGLGATAVLRATRRWELALLTVALEAALLGFAGSFYDLVRPDALALFLVALGATLAARGGVVRALAAGVVLALACFAKQTALLAGLGVVAGIGLTRDRRLFVSTLVAAGVAGALGFLLLERATAGMFSFFVYSGHQSHHFARTNVLFYAHRDVLHLAPILLVVPLVWLHRKRPDSYLPLLLAGGLGVAVLQRALVSSDLPHMYFRDLWYPRSWWMFPPIAIAAIALLGTKDTKEPRARRPQLFWGAIFLGAVAASAVGHATQWAFKNALTPLVVLGVPFVVLALAELGRTTRAAPSWLAALVALQLVALYDSPMKRAPSALDRARWDELRAELGAIEGKVMVLGHPRLAWDLGDGEHLHGMGIADLASMGGIPDLAPRLAAHEWSAIVTDADDYVDAPGIVATYYERVKMLDGPPMKTGSLCRPRALWMPKRATP
jgi:4-amino-4-deoxy-L-arabinose transferase-like glycosyltransferase